MSEVVFVLGAGASREGGAPLMNDFLDVAHALWKTGQVADYAEDFERVFRALGDLQQVHSKSRLNIHNIEAVFAAFEMAKTLNRFGAYDANDIDALITAMRAVIVSTIQNSLRFPVSDGYVHPPPPYPEFVGLVKTIQEDRQRRRACSVITFNYDLALDFACYQGGLGVRYGLGEDEAGSLPLLKLHGSLNWGYCRECNSVAPWPLREYFARHDWNRAFVRDFSDVTLDLSQHLSEFVHCESAIDSSPVVVPPTWNKTEHHRSLSAVWACAAKELSDAEDVYVIGYSLPESDAFFRYLYALGTVGEVRLRRFWVFNPDRTGATQKRFAALLGPGAEQRFNYFDDTFSEAIDTLTEHLHAAQ